MYTRDCCSFKTVKFCVLQHEWNWRVAFSETNKEQKDRYWTISLLYGTQANWSYRKFSVEGNNQGLGRMGEWGQSEDLWLLSSVREGCWRRLYPVNSRYLQCTIYFRKQKEGFDKGFSRDWNKCLRRWACLTDWQFTQCICVPKYYMVPIMYSHFTKPYS